jgi:hypothetical protein
MTTAPLLQRVSQQPPPVMLWHDSKLVSSSQTFRYKQPFPLFPNGLPQQIHFSGSQTPIYAALMTSVCVVEPVIKSSLPQHTVHTSNTSSDLSSLVSAHQQPVQESGKDPGLLLAVAVMIDFFLLNTAVHDIVCSVQPTNEKASGTRSTNGNSLYAPVGSHDVGIWTDGCPPQYCVMFPAVVVMTLRKLIPEMFMFSAIGYPLGPLVKLLALLEAPVVIIRIFSLRIIGCCRWSKADECIQPSVQGCSTT